MINSTAPTSRSMNTALMNNAPEAWSLSVASTCDAPNRATKPAATPCNDPLAGCRQVANHSPMTLVASPSSSHGMFLKRAAAARIRNSTPIAASAAAPLRLRNRVAIAATAQMAPNHSIMTEKSADEVAMPNVSTATIEGRAIKYTTSSRSIHVDLLPPRSATGMATCRAASSNSMGSMTSAFVGS